MMNSFVSAMLSAANGIDFHPEAISEMLPKLGDGNAVYFSCDWHYYIADYAFK